MTDNHLVFRLMYSKSKINVLHNVVQCALKCIKNM